MRTFFFLFFFSTFFLCFSQTTFQGTLRTEKGSLISAATITITEINKTAIISYTVTDVNGQFVLSFNSEKERLQLHIRSLGFETIVETIINTNQVKNFILKEKITDLKEVIVKSNSIYKRGDTINYAVNSFTKKEDRTISDVLKNMPGIEVLPDGKILYHGKPINKYYIEGLDLLEGKYNLANNNLPHKEVTKVQILENHQPIKILDTLVYSDQAAINIKLKNNFTFTGQAQLGSGFSPLLWQANLTPMLFSKQRQMLSSYQTNNIGNDITSQLKTLTIEDILEQFEQNNEKQNWLGIQELEVPLFSEERWLKNNVHLLSTNYLNKLKNNYELRLNISYINDYQQQKGFSITQFFTVNNTIELFENTTNQHYKNALDTNITLQKNTKNNFFKNTLQFQGSWNKHKGSILLDNTDVNQDFKDKYFRISNKLKTLFPIGKQIITLNSYLDYNKTPQSLNVKPGQFNDLLNNGDIYNEVIQNLEIYTFYFNNSISFTKAWKQFSFTPQVGLQFERQNLSSDLFASSNTTETTSFQNNLEWIRSKIDFNLQIQYKKDKWRMELITPINFYSFIIEDRPLQKEQSLNRYTFEPRFSISHDLSSFWRIGSYVSLSNQFGTINQMYYNYILLSYRNLRRIDAPLPEIKKSSYSLTIGYKNPLKSEFFNFIYTTSISENNLIYDTQILTNGATELKAIEKDNQRLTHNFSTRINKYFSSLNTNLSLNASYGIQGFQQILNSEITDVIGQNWHFNVKIDKDITDWFNTELESTFQFTNNKIQYKRNKTIKQQSHKFNINTYPNEYHYIGLKTEYLKNDLFSKKAKNFFADIVYRYTWKKKNIDFELNWNNIFNVSEYKTININDYYYIENSFYLRPSQMFCKIRFSL